MLNALVDKLIIVFFICVIIALVFGFTKDSLKQISKKSPEKKNNDTDKKRPKVPFIHSVKTEIAHGAVIEIRDDHTGEVNTYTMTDSKFTIGREGSRQNNTVSLPSKSVSDRHLEITYHIDEDGPFYRIKNLSGSNPTEYLTTKGGKKRWLFLQKGDDIDLEEGITSLYVADYKIIIKVPRATHSISSSDLRSDENNNIYEGSEKLREKETAKKWDIDSSRSTKPDKTDSRSEDTYFKRNKTDFNPDDRIRSDRIIHVADL